MIAWSSVTDSSLGRGLRRVSLTGPALAAALAVVAACGGGPAPTDRIISIRSWELSTTQGGCCESDLAIEFVNAGGRPFAAPLQVSPPTYDAGAPYPWLDVELAPDAVSGGYSGLLRLDAADLPAGDNVATFTISSTSVQNSPYVYSLPVHISPRDGPILGLSNWRTHFATAPGVDPEAQAITMFNRGTGGAIARPAATLSDPSSAWLEATVTGDAEPYLLTIQPHVAGLPAGEYQGTIQLSAPATPSPLLRLVRVFLKISG